MQINRINGQPNFKAVNQKYFEWAKKDYSLEKNVSGELLQRLRYDVCLFKNISPQDGVDTLKAIIKYIGKCDEFTLHVLDNLNQCLRDSI